MQDLGLPDMEGIVTRSLARSLSYGVDLRHDGAPLASRLSDEALNKRIQDQYAFFSLAHAQVEALYRLLQGTGFCMAIADKDGYVLHVQGDHDLLEHFKNRRCMPGYCWTERTVGTCAIGLALEEKVPVFLTGEQMYAKLAQSVANAGAPVFSPEGELLGALTLSGKTDSMHVHTLGLMRQSAETITSQLREAERTRELAIKNSYMAALLDSDSRGIITVDTTGYVVQANAKARLLFDIPDGSTRTLFQEYLAQNVDIEQLLQEKKPFQVREISTKQRGITHFISLDLIHMPDGELVGALFTIVAKKDMMRVAVEMAGTHARFTFDSILGESESLQKALHMARIAATSLSPVLITGETGTGKELFAQAVHNASPSQEGPFVAINCGAIPKELIESELFGYEEGTFTGAQKGGRPGKLELADGGTVFLDEIGDMPFDMQVKLLRVLQTGEVQRIGGLRPLPIQFRIIAATNKDIKLAVDEQQFRPDLYYRISTLHIAVPPLRERKEDIVFLAQYFMERYAWRLNRTVRTLPPESSKVLREYRWPGNIRQLENAIDRAVHVALDGPIMPEHFGIMDMLLTHSDAVLEGASSSLLALGTEPLRLADMEQHVIRLAVLRHQGNMLQCAKELGISRPTLYRKVAQYQLDRYCERS